MADEFCFETTDFEWDDCGFDGELPDEESMLDSCFTFETETVRDSAEADVLESFELQINAPVTDIYSLTWTEEDEEVEVAEEVDVVFPDVPGQSEVTIQETVDPEMVPTRPVCRPLFLTHSVVLEVYR